MKPRYALILALLVLPLESYAQARILIESRSHNGGGGLAGLVERCAALAIDRAGFRAVPADAEPPAGGALAALLRCESRLVDGSYDLKLELVAANDGGRGLGATELSGPLSLDFDESLIVAVSQLISAAGLDPALAKATSASSGAAEAASIEADLAELIVRDGRAPAAPLVQARSGPALAEPAPASAAAALPAAAAPLLASGQEPAVQVAEAPRPQARPLPAAEEGPAFRSSSARFSLSFASAPFFVLGEAAGYFHYGFDCSSSFGFRFVHRDFELDAAARLGYALVYSAGTVSGELQLASLGPELRAIWPASGLFSLRLRAGGGPLYLAATSGEAAFLGKVLPFAACGLGLDFRPTAAFCLGLEVGFLVVFERSLPLYGLAPGLSAAWRL